MLKLDLLLLLIVSSSYGADTTSKARPAKHHTNLIVGGGSAGLYTAWRLSSARAKNESTAIYEWSPHRLGGRVLTKKFSGGQFLELGAMRFTSQHELLNQVLRELNLTGLITDFSMTNNRLYYVRGRHIYHDEIPRKGMPYDTPYNKMNPDSLFDNIAQKLFPSGEESRAKWCTFFDEGLFPANATSHSYKTNDIVGNIGYWNLLQDQFGLEGMSYAKDAGGFSSAVLNSNAAYTIYANKRMPPFKRLKNGYSELIRAFEGESVKKHVEINKGQRLMEFYWNAAERKFHATFISYDKDGKASGRTLQVTSDRLFLCVPKRSLNLIKETDVVGDWPASKQRRVLKHTPGEFYINSVIRGPAYKIALVYNHPWWLNATHKPDLFDPVKEPSKVAWAKNYGPTVTDLPIRQIYYFGNNNDINKEERERKYGLLAAYDDMENTYFWNELELPANERLRPEDPSFLQGLFAGTKVPDVMHDMLRAQLNMVHYGNAADWKVPKAEEGYFMNWGHDPYGSGYHTWKAHYKIADAQYYMTRPSEAIGMYVPVHVAGESYAFDQRWIEGALTTAEAILVDKIGLRPLLKKSTAEYPLICRPKSKS